MTVSPDQRVCVRALLEDSVYVRFCSDQMHPSRWDAYSSATDGTTYVKALRANLAPIDKVPDIIIRLRDADFDLDVAEDLKLVLDDKTAQQWVDLKSTRHRIARIDEEMWKRLKERMRPYQKFGAQWLALRTGALLADEQRLGKTLQCIVAMPSKAPVFIICPNVVKFEWVAEIKHWRPQLTVTILKPGEPFRWPKIGEALIFNYERLPDIHDREGRWGRKCLGKLPAKPCKGCSEPKVVMTANRIETVRDGHLEDCTGLLKPEDCPGCHPLLKDAPPNVVVVIDEAHWVKHKRSQRSQRAIALAAAARAKGGRTWLLTGTPFENQPQELWNVYELANIAEEAFGDFPTYMGLWNAHYVGRGIEWGMPKPEVKDRMRRVSLRRMRAEVWPHLPPKVWRSLEVDVDANAMKECAKFLRTIDRPLDEMIDLIATEKIPFNIMSSVRAALATAKIPAMLARVEQHEAENDPIIVFSAHRAPIDVLAKRRGWLTITGDIKEAKEKKRIADLFQTGKYKGIGLTISAGGVGIRLDLANEVLMVDRDYRPSVNAQAEDRGIGYDDKRGLVVTSLVAKHQLDIRMIEILIAKQMLITASVDASSVKDDAPDAAGGPFAEYLRRVGQEISMGAPRHVAECAAEREALEILRAVFFKDAGDERVATKLAQEADAIGLSRGQWVVAIELAKRAGEESEAEPRGVEIAPDAPDSALEVVGEANAGAEAPEKRRSRGTFGRGRRAGGDR